MKTKLYRYCALILFQLLGLSPIAAQTQVPFDSDRWYFQEYPKRPGTTSHEMKEYLGKSCILLRNTEAQLKDANFINGIIEYDVAFGPERKGIGILFRMKDAANCESFFIRPHQSGNADATQYMPLYQNMDSWQLYYGQGYTAPVSFTFNQWVHFKLVVSGTQMEVFMGDMEKPVLYVPELKRQVQEGMISLFGNGTRFANFSYTHLANPTIKSTPLPIVPVSKGTITQWQVSQSFPEKNLDKLLQLTSSQMIGLSWQSMTTEKTGLLNLATGPTWSKENNTTFARLIIESDRVQIKPLQLGFSDRAKVYLNDQLLYSGHDEFQSRDYRFMGTVGYYDELYLPLKKGRNELWVAVSENFGGWGIKAAIDDQSGIKIQTDFK